jgi:ABC-type Fe3+ transport system substrate-binding protein
VVVKLVGRGEAWVGLTDSDDIRAGFAQGWPVLPVPVQDGGFLIRNSAAIVRGAPHRAMAEKLLAYLQSHPVMQKLLDVGALDGTDEPSQRAPDWQDLLKTQSACVAKLEEIFLR